MAVRVILSSTLRDYCPGYNPASGISVDLVRSLTIADLCRSLNIPVDRVKIIMVNGRSETLHYVLRDDDRVGLFPPIGGG